MTNEDIKHIHNTHKCCKKKIPTLYDKFPSFSKKSVHKLDMSFPLISSEDHIKAGKWMIIFFYPKDFTFVCPTEIQEFSNKADDFSQRNAVLYGASTDSEFVHLAWRQNSPLLKDLKIPLISDLSKSLCRSLGILTKDEEEIAFRSTYIVDPEGTIKWISHYPLEAGRNPEEVLRILDALQSGGMTPCNWKKGDDTL